MIGFSFLSRLVAAFGRSVGWCPEPPRTSPSRIGDAKRESGRAAELVLGTSKKAGILEALKGVVLSPDSVFDRMKANPSYLPGVITVLTYGCAQIPFLVWLNSLFDGSLGLFFIPFPFLMVGVMIMPAMVWFAIGRLLGGKGGLQSTICGFWLTRITKLPSLLPTYLSLCYFPLSILGNGIPSFEEILAALPQEYTLLSHVTGIVDVLTSFWVAFLLWRLLMHIHEIDRKKSLIAIAAPFALHLTLRLASIGLLDFLF